MSTDITPARTPSSSRSDLQKTVREKPQKSFPAYSHLKKIAPKNPRKRFRGVPPPLPFDINALPASTRFTETETAAVIRRAKSCLENWRKYPDHPLRWRRVSGRILYELSSIREFLKGEAK